LSGGYLAHSANEANEVDFLRSHLEGVATLAAEYASQFDASEEARIAGLLHDLGKYGDLFQERLKGHERGIDHWSAGAWAALLRYEANGIASALAIQGHHLGLQEASKDHLSQLNPEILQANHPLGLRLSEKDISVLLQRLADDGLTLPSDRQVEWSIYSHSDDFHTSRMLDIRMLYSALVDADFIETEAHFKARPESGRRYRESGLPLNPGEGLEALKSYVELLANQSEASQPVSRMRSDLFQACLNASLCPPGLFTLTAPTGTGKTLGLLAFALKHAAKNNLRRIVTVIPYLTIIEQTAEVYRKVFDPLHDSSADRYVLEHHSMAEVGAARRYDDSDESEEETKGGSRLLAENWDAPIIVTTSVQFLESLFSNRPSACRKLHRLSNSVILLDEVQTLPVSLAVPTLATLSHLVERYGASVVFSTATQPAFSHLDAEVRKYCKVGWQPKEIVPPSLELFHRAKRTRVEWPRDLAAGVSWEQLARRLAGPDCRQSLCIVNLKRHAVKLFRELESLESAGLYHLSTNMCPAHRTEVLKRVREAIVGGQPCRLISTQCVEAGVDLDFPVVFRAWGPLDAIAQAAGRCNRSGLSKEGIVGVFIPEQADYPDGAYRQAAGVTRMLYKKSGSIDIDSADTFAEYYRDLYDLCEPGNINAELASSIRLQDFAGAAEHYCVIDRQSVNVLVPYDMKQFSALKNKALRWGLTRRWMVQARPHSIGLFRPRPNDLVWPYLDPIPIEGRSVSDEWFIYLAPEHYSAALGLALPDEADCLIG
jgi:CRISPR-associated helicase Cas3/CRISPR-associated endonuclease Cas3-HD